jgi:hypothetical protein
MSLLIALSALRLLSRLELHDFGFSAATTHGKFEHVYCGFNLCATYNQVQKKRKKSNNTNLARN